MNNKAALLPNKYCYFVHTIFLLAVQARIEKALDLARRLMDAKMELAEKAYDRIDNAIQRMDADLKKMEVRLASYTP